MAVKDIYFHQRKCSHKKSYLIQHCCSRQLPTCADYQKLGNACCLKAHYCIERNSFPHPPMQQEDTWSSLNHRQWVLQCRKCQMIHCLALQKCGPKYYTLCFYQGHFLISFNTLLLCCINRFTSLCKNLFNMASKNFC